MGGIRIIALALAVLALAFAGCGGGDDEKKADTAEATQTVSFQEPEDPGPDPFTEPADVEGDDAVPVSNPSGTGAEQPFGGSGSKRVCDRDKLIRFLKARPEVMREWARVLGIAPRFSVVRKYIAKLHPVTLTRDTQVTNHGFKDGRAFGFQAILQAGTAVLVDEHGKPVVKCYCGNPLKPAVPVKTAKCTGCPPNYKPPPQCKYGDFEDYDETYYPADHYSNGHYDRVFIKRITTSRYRRCYSPYPDPPVVTTVDVYPSRAAPRRPPPPPPTPAPQPRRQGLQCDPPRSQLEFERCRDLERRATEPEPAPEPQPEPEPPVQTTPMPDICNDGLDNEGESGLVDGADPNCQ